MHIKSYYVSRWCLLKNQLIMCRGFRVKVTLKGHFISLWNCATITIGPVFSHAAGIYNVLSIMRSLERNLCLANLCSFVCSKFCASEKHASKNTLLNQL